MKNSGQKLNILFVCTGNTCRSPMAEYMFKDFLKSKKLASKFKTASAGICPVRGDILNPIAAQALTMLKVPFNAQRKARTLTVAAALSADLIIGMSKAHAETAGEGALSYYSFIGKDIADPYGGSLDDYLDAAFDIRRGFEPILEYIESKVHSDKEKQ